MNNKSYQMLIHGVDTFHDGDDTDDVTWHHDDDNWAIIELSNRFLGDLGCIKIRN